MQSPFLISWRLAMLPLLLLACSGCVAAPTYADVQATAQIGGCWPGNWPTPRPATITPVTRASAANSTTPDPQTLTSTSLPTITPYPRCPAAPSETLVPWPTPVPPAPPYPTRAPRPHQEGSAEQNTLTLPGQIYQIDMAVHPTENWPVIGAMQRWNLSTDPAMVVVRVYNPVARRWGAAQQVDIGVSSVGHNPFATIAVGVTGDRTVLAAWGNSDRDGGIWTSSSTNYGTTWSEPHRLTTNCWGVNGLATASDGQAVVLASCYSGDGDNLTAHTKLVVRRADGEWLAPSTVNVPGWFGTVVIIGDGADAHAIALTTSHAEPNNIAYLLLHRLSDTGAWQVQTRQIEPAGIDSSGGAYHLHQRGIVWARQRQDGSVQSGVTFVWHGQYHASALALTSLDGGQTWGQVEPVLYRPGQDITNVQFVAPAYDPASDRLLAIWTDGDPATHYARWSVPGSGIWRAPTPTGADGAIPIVLGARDAGQTVTAQAQNSRTAWISWIEQNRRVEVRSLDLNQIVPADQYPPAVPPIAPVREVQP